MDPESAERVDCAPSPRLEVIEERRRFIPRARAVGELGVKFNWVQVVGRLISVMFEFSALSFVAWLYSYWRSEPTTRVDVLLPSFFPVAFGILTDTYEIVSLLLLNRKRAINPVAVCSDVAVIGTGIFCFLLLSMVDRGTGERRGYWATDMRNAMIFIIVFCAIHSGFIVLAAGGVIRIYLAGKRARREAQLARSQAGMVEFNERQRQLLN
ncbi:hypothetical protein VTI74DRAFT_5066 [Chaetomium olivicolor]